MPKLAFSEILNLMQIFYEIFPDAEISKETVMFILQGTDDLLMLTPNRSQCHKADSAMYQKVAFIAVAVTVTVTFLVIFFPDTMPSSVFTVVGESHISTSRERPVCKDQCR